MNDLHRGQISDFNGTIDILRTVFSGQTFLWRQVKDSQSSVKTVIPSYHSPTDKSERLRVWNPVTNNKTDYKTVSWDASFHADSYINKRFNLNTDYAKRDSAVRNQLNITDPSIRVLQEPFWPTVVSFICSSATNMERILTMQRNIIQSIEPVSEYPSVEELSSTSIEKLRDAGLGYRAEYVHKTAQSFGTTENMLQIYNQLQEIDTEKAQSELMQYTGIGEKVADCICLYSLNKFDALPVDTHISEIDNPEQWFAETVGHDNRGIAQLYVFSDRSNAETMLD